MQMTAQPMIMNGLTDSWCTPHDSQANYDKHRAKLAQRYALSASVACIGDYVARWTLWCTSVLRCVYETTQFNQSMMPLAAVGRKH